jgi:hypothetical protein
MNNDDTSDNSALDAMYAWIKARPGFDVRVTSECVLGAHHQLFDVQIVCPQQLLEQFRPDRPVATPRRPRIDCLQTAFDRAVLSLPKLAFGRPFVEFYVGIALNFKAMHDSAMYGTDENGIELELLPVLRDDGPPAAWSLTVLERYTGEALCGIQGEDPAALIRCIAASGIRGPPLSDVVKVHRVYLASIGAVEIQTREAFYGQLYYVSRLYARGTDRVLATGCSFLNCSASRHTAIRALIDRPADLCSK